MSLEPPKSKQSKPSDSRFEQTKNKAYNMAFKTIALFGANGQIGNCILRALLGCKRQSFTIIAFISPNKKLQIAEQAQHVETYAFDLTTARREDLAAALKDVDVVVSALNGKALEAQGLIQDAAADAGVKRFYPSEYGMHNIYRKPGDPRGYIHPVSPPLFISPWNPGLQCNGFYILATA